MDPHEQLLLRYLDGSATPAETARLGEWLRSDPAARAHLRDVAEQAVAVADAARSEAAGAGLQTPIPPAPARFPRATRVLPLAWAAALALLVGTALAVSLAAWRHRDAVSGRILSATGMGRHFGARNPGDAVPAVGARLAAGDTLETHSCDAAVTVGLRRGGSLSIGGHSVLRVIDGRAPSRHFALDSGFLSLTPRAGPAPERIRIDTPAASIDFLDAQAAVGTGNGRTLVRVNTGVARVARLRDGALMEVPAGHQVVVSLTGLDETSVAAQPAPRESWAWDAGVPAGAVLGEPVPAADGAPPRFGASPLLWPIPDRDPILLHAVSVAAWRTSPGPVALGPASVLTFRGRTRSAETVRFGFSTQRMHGVFAGKFEVDIPPARLASPGTTWEISIPVSDFHPLSPEFNASPAGLELTDVYALTVQVDAGLQVEAIRLDTPLLHAP